MDWRFNSIWFEQLDQKKYFSKDYKENTITTKLKSFEKAEYAIIWHLKEGSDAFDNLPKSERLLYLELNWANGKNFDGIQKFTNLKRLELHYCVKLENDFGLKRLSDSLQFLHINQSKKFQFTKELLRLKKLRVLCLNNCGPIDNLDFLKSFPNLIGFRFVNTNILDGNLQPILDHPTLRSVGFLNKKHYNYKSEKLKSALEDKFTDTNRKIVHKGYFSTFRYDYE